MRPSFYRLLNSVHRLKGSPMTNTVSSMSLANDRMKDVSIVPLPPSGSQFVRPYRIHYTDVNHKSRIYDAVQVHDAVSIVVYSLNKQTLIMVRQLRPVVFITIAKERSKKATVSQLNKEDFDRIDDQLAVTYELCSGVVDKATSLKQIALDEVEEECGYKVPEKYLQEITALRGSLGIHGSKLTIYYCEVTDEMKVSEGGGKASEHEYIEVCEIGIGKVRELFYDESVGKAPSLMVGLMWFLYEREDFLRKSGYVSPTVSKNK